MPERSATKASASKRARRQRARRRKLTAAGVGLLVVVGGGSAAYAATDDGGATLTTATVTSGPITQTVAATGTVASASETEVSFAANGTVSTVAVKAGDSVTKGEVIARIATSSLQSTVDSDTADVASAQQKLDDDETGQTSSASTASQTGTGNSSSTGLSGDSAGSTAITTAASSSAPTATPTTTPSTPVTGSTTGPGTTASGSATASVAQIKSAQQKLISAQQKLDQAQAGVDAAQKTIDAAVLQNTALRNAQATACGTTGTSGSSGTSGTTSTASPSDACVSAEADYAAYADTLTADSAVLDQAIGAQDAAVSALDQAVSALDGLIGKLSTSTSSGSGSAQKSTGQTAGSGSGSSSSSSKSSTAGAGSSTTTTVASATQLAADQADIDAAAAELTLAQQNLAAATLTSPIAGTVASVGFTVGASSSGHSITILGTGNQVVTINVPLSEIDQVKTGQSASVVVDGQSKALSGTVTKIGILSTTSGSLTTFPVTVTLAAGSPSVHDGVGASVVVTTGAASTASLVPNSAIVMLGTRHSVIVIKNGKAQTEQITIGLTGSTQSQVTQGLAVGDVVEIADSSQGLPSSATTATTTTRGAGAGSGTFPGAGTFPAGGGFPGGR